MNKEHEELLDEVYKNYTNTHTTFKNEFVHVTPMQHSKETFINECKLNTEFSEMWGLKIEERELSFEERCEIQIARLEGMYSSGKEVFIQHSVNDVKQITMDKNNIPTKLITITYKDKTIESYE